RIAAQGVAEEQARAAAQMVANEETELVWIDRATGLMWAKDSNSSDVTPDEARAYCRTLRLAGHSDWKLPAIDELAGMCDRAQFDGRQVYVKGGISLHDGMWAWSRSAGSNSNATWGVNFLSGERDVAGRGYSFRGRALCVRRSGK
ncbi:MAG: DUF1566 domain-containing protein, partial [Candidatus Sulfotelmatobacter sp.]